MGEVKATPNHRGYHRCSSGLGASGVASKRLKIRRRPLMLRAALSLLLATALVTAGGDIPSLRAPDAKPSSSATRTKTFIKCSRSIDYSYKWNNQLSYVVILVSTA